MTDFESQVEFNEFSDRMQRFAEWAANEYSLGLLEAEVVMVHAIEGIILVWMGGRKSINDRRHLTRSVKKAIRNKIKDLAKRRRQWRQEIAEAEGWELFGEYSSEGFQGIDLVSKPTPLKARLDQISGDRSRQIVRMVQGGMKQVDVARELGISKARVSRVMAKWRKGG